MTDDPVYEEGDRVAFMRVAPLTDEIQIMPAVFVRMIDAYRALIRFPNGTEIPYPVGDLTRVPPS